jgi:hypothetical protein
VESRLLLDIVVAEGAAILELLAGEDQALLIRGDAAMYEPWLGNCHEWNQNKQRRTLPCPESWP